MSEAVAETPIDDTKHGSAEEGSEKDEQLESENEIKDEEKEEEEEPSPKKPRMSKDNTMTETAKSAKDFLGKEKIDELRSSTRAVRESKASAKRATTMVKTAREGEALLKDMGLKDDNPDSQRRRTRSQTRGTPLPPQKAAKQESNKRNTRRGRPRKSGKPEVEEEKDETKSEDMNSAEEEKEATEEQNAKDGPKAEDDDEQATQKETKNEEESAD